MMSRFETETKRPCESAPMHNVKRMTAERRLAARVESEARAEEYCSLSRALSACRETAQHDEHALLAATRVVRVNPDMATAWNFRREVLQGMYAQGGSREGAGEAEVEREERRNACEEEFRLTQECLSLNPKSYPVWFHREWILTWGRCSYQYAHELKLTAKLLSLDDRNFHCWTYRRAVVKMASVSPESELEFTTNKIEQNFSNYSAWHYRSKLLLSIYQPSRSQPSSEWRARLLEELQLVRNAFFTAPEDSSAWFYHRWLLAQLEAADATETTPLPEQFTATLKDEMAMVEELMELEPESKWPLAAAIHIGKAVSPVEPKLSVRCEEWLCTLLKVDPSRANYYRHLLKAEGA